MTKANAIRKYCLECAGGSPGEATLCHIVDCPLWTYRFGTSINDRRFELRMKAAMRDYPDEIGEVLSLIAGYLSDMPNSPEKSQIRAFLKKFEIST